MKISYNWLKDYVKINISAEKLAQRLTMAGMEVEKIERVNGDIVFDIEITPNRPDCLNMLGIAREVAAVLEKDRKLPLIPKIKYPRVKCDIQIADKKGCSRYIGTVIEGISIQKTRENILRRISALGLRPVNDVVDITNFCLFETGQPLHVFDYDKLEGRRIVVRRAQEGERIVTIDGVERHLDASILVIADAQKSVAIAGVMGGKEAEVTPATKNVLLESAYFDPVLIRRASRKLGLSSDSSYRFERGVDYEGVERSARRAAALILDSTGGKVTRYVDIALSRKKESKAVIAVSVERINSFLGAEFAPVRYKGILKRLGFHLVSHSGDCLKITPPSYRADVKQEWDVIEEVSRIIGYDHLPASLPLVKATDIRTDETREFRRRVRELLIARGFCEAVTYTMINKKALQRTRQENFHGIGIQNPLTADQEMMRPTFLPSLLPVVLGNINRGQRDLRIFETGKIYLAGGEREAVGIISTGARDADWRKERKEAVNYYDMKGVVEQVLARLGLERAQFQPGEQAYFDPGESVMVTVDEEPLGVMGKINQEVLSNWEIKQKQDIYFTFLDLEKMKAKTRLFEQRRYEPVSEYPAVVRDVSLALSKDISFRKVRDLVAARAGDILGGITFNEEYLGEKIPADRRGIVFSLNYQSSRRTLREDEVNAIHEKVITALVSELGATVR